MYIFQLTVYLNQMKIGSARINFSLSYIFKQLKRQNLLLALGGPLINDSQFDFDSF